MHCDALRCHSAPRASWLPCRDVGVGFVCERGPDCGALCCSCCPTVAIVTLHALLRGRYDAIFAYGFDETFNEFLQFYPIESERTALYHAVANSLGFSPSELGKDASSVRAWAEGKSEADIFAASKEGAGDASEPAVAALQYVANADDFDFYYSRLHGIGVIKLMVSAGVDLTPENAGRWSDELKVPKAKLTTELGTYEAAVERLKAAEQLFAEIAARDARKTAERLERRAEQAAAEATEAEKEV